MESRGWRTIAYSSGCCFGRGKHRVNKPLLRSHTLTHPGCSAFGYLPEPALEEQQRSAVADIDLFDLADEDRVVSCDMLVDYFAVHLCQAAVHDCRPSLGHADRDRQVAGLLVRGPSVVLGDRLLVFAEYVDGEAAES